MRLGHVFARHRGHHLWWNRASQHIECHHVLVVAAARLNHRPETPGLELHLHEQRPVEVIRLGEGGVATPSSHLTNHPLNGAAARGIAAATASLSQQHSVVDSAG
jgi:hypothetical protein